MNWKREAVEKLRSYSGRKASLSRTKEEIRQLEGDLRAIKSQLGRSGTPSGGGGGTDDAIVGNIALREELKRNQRQTLQWVRQMDDALKLLDSEERLVLEWCYMRHTKGAVDDLCEKLSVEKSTVYRRREDALRKFTLAYYGAIET